MQQKTHDFLVRMQVPMATFGGDLMGEAIDFAIQEMRNNRFVTLTDIENVLSDRFHCSASSADARLRRALYVTEFRCGEYPNPELERLRAEYRVDRWSVKRFIYAAARRGMNDFDCFSATFWPKIHFVAKNFCKNGHKILR